MYRKYLCLDWDCSVYVFGTSTGGTCPECGATGVLTSDECGLQLVELINAEKGRLNRLAMTSGDSD